MRQELWTKVEEYFAPVVQEDEALRAAAKEGEKAGLPPIAVSPNEGKLLLLMAKIVGARKILEVGTLAGYSTIWLARGLSAGGRLITLEYEKKHADVAGKNIERAGLAGIVDIRVGDATKTMPELLKERAGPFDLIFLDANKDGYPAYFGWALQLSRKGTVIIADNVVRDGGVIDAESKDASIQGVRRLNQMIAAERRVIVKELQSGGQKVYEGVS